MTARATFDPSRELDLFLRINRDGSKTLNFFNSAGAPYLLTGRSFVLNFKRYANDSANFLQLTNSTGLTIGTSTIEITITKEKAAKFREQSYFWELVVTKDTLEKNWLTGNAWFHNGKFDGVGNPTENLAIYETGEIINITINESGTSGGGGTGSQWYRGDFNPSGNTFPSTGSGTGNSILVGDTYLMTTGSDPGPGVVIGTLDGVEVYYGTRITARYANAGQNKEDWIFDFGAIIYDGGVVPPEDVTADSDTITADNNLITADNG